jgi:serine/threonine-protein kinase
MIGQEIGKYRVTSAIGEGGMGAVYLATHTLIGRQAAIKVLLPELSHNQEIVNRFFNEARATTAIKHPGIVEIYDFGYHTNGSAFIVMEFLEGESLSARIRRMGRLGHDQALNIIRQVAGALSAAHKAGIVHRDLKPDNIFLISDPEVTGGERIKILDFGIAKLQGDGGMVSQTRTGAVMGTPAYMAPEQCKGAGRVDARADLYAMGCMLFEMICGRLPFVGEGSGEVLAAHIHVAPPQPRGFDPSISPELEALILRLLAKNANQRPDSADALIAEIDALGVSPWRAATSQPYHTGPTPVVMPTPNPTTLSSAAAAYQSQHPSQVSGGTGKSKALPIGLGLAVVAGGIGVAVALSGGGGGDKGDPSAAKSNDAPVTASESANKGSRAEKKTAVSATAPRTLLWTVKSKPQGAEVYRKSDGIRLGRTPYGYTFEPTAGDLVFVIKKDGYKDQTLSVPAAKGGERMVELVALAKPKKVVKRTRPRRTHRTSPKKKKKKKRRVSDDDAPNPFDY